jgi:hypothetical protein
LCCRYVLVRGMYEAMEAAAEHAKVGGPCTSEIQFRPAA